MLLVALFEHNTNNLGHFKFIFI